jgi:hypothetical protein
LPHLTLDIEPQGPLLPAAIGVSESRRLLLAAAKRTLPDLQVGRALVDTGASSSVVDHALITPLGIAPSSYTMVHTPSTDGKPVQQPVYDVSIWLYHAATKHFLERSFPVMCANLRAQGIDILLGRDILGECLLVFDGPERRFCIAF